ncbi:hypothetical protein ASD64_06225 [Mesorhizobium sp. Root157]|uniref:hypothetical protein n=1 Tax=Mesorhizobium sp. Root157 TaxID=1736477 RepID=UPI0006FC8604|nr:hypothetical protein [Mesorhizobium sp. Root157]KQZ87046.1 hypothetical protein ASD64_06225 [Mesorhizobium sp. Root157]
MKDASENLMSSEASSALSDAIREVKNGFADRDDVVVDMREAHRMRLELMAAELAPVFAEAPSDMDNFDFAISSGLQPRLWIDAVSHVAMGRDRRTFRFVRDTRLGRVVLAESTDMKTVAAQVTRYIAERIVEHERMKDGDEVEIAAGFGARAGSKVESVLEAAPRNKLLSALLTGLAIIAAGALVGLIFALVLFWDRIVAMKVTF